MDQLTRYRGILRQVLKDYCHRPSHGDIAPEAVIDAEGNHFELMLVGWDGQRRVHGCVLHMDLIDDQVWIQFDGTSRGVAWDLEEAGIPREDIVLAFKPVHLRPHTKFGVGKRENAVALTGSLDESRLD